MSAGISLFAGVGQQFFDNSGIPLAGGLIYSYAAGTTTPAATYTNASGVTPQTNPIVLNAAGRVPSGEIWLTIGLNYKFELKTSANVTLATYDNVAGGVDYSNLAASTGASLVGYSASNETLSITPNTVANRLNLLDRASRVATNSDGAKGGGVSCYRNATAVTGGSVGYVNSSIHNQTDTGATETAFEWGITSVLNNNSAAGENVAIYGQGNKRANGATWAGVFEARDFLNTVGATSGVVGIEVDVFANGVDTSTNRVGIDIVVGKGVSGGTKATISYGIRMGAQSGDTTQGKISSGLRLNNEIDYGVFINSSGISGINFGSGAAYTVGLNLTLGTFSSDAIRLDRLQSIAYEVTGTIKSSLASASSVLGYFNGTERVGLDISATPNLRLQGIQVVGVRDTGYAPFTGTINKGTTYATSTITLVQLAERVGQLQATMVTHGLIGA